MVKGLIWFNDMALYNKCEIEARRAGISCALDYISFQVENYLEKIDSRYAPKIIISKKTGENNSRKYFKNNIDIWLALKDQADKQNMTVPALMERICSDLLQPNTGQSAIINQAEAVIQQENVNRGYTIDAPWSRKKL